MRAIRTLIDVLRGAMMGAVEAVPGVSSGTIAMLVGVYETLIDSAGNLVRGLVLLVVDPLRRRGTSRAKAHLQQVEWNVIIPLLVGMVAAALLAIRIIAPLVENYPVQSRALFAGLILVSLIVPARMVGGWGIREILLVIPAAVVGFVLTGLPSTSQSDPSLWLVFIVAAVAICALVIPGTSGSLVLVVVGLYEPTLRAVNERNFAYIAVFAAGAILGLGSFVQVLRWLLKHRRKISLAIMTGLMAGSLRALWPWQDESRGLLAPSTDIGPAILFFVVGIAFVGAILIAESALVRRRLASGEDSLHPEDHPEFNDTELPFQHRASEHPGDQRDSNDHSRS
ncbi:DUF368 domain-containing protein [Humidisolicoccus flavus]|uniref:DUF368 domain-containing protein n=1 Tax=Humidisolicoccus flavus TaxID=3111414 RepID=UPI00324F3C31